MKYSLSIEGQKKRFDQGEGNVSSTSIYREKEVIWFVNLSGIKCYAPRRRHLYQHPLGWEPRQWSLVRGSWFQPALCGHHSTIKWVIQVNKYELTIYGTSDVRLIIRRSAEALLLWLGSVVMHWEVREYCSSVKVCPLRNRWLHSRQVIFSNCRHQLSRRLRLRAKQTKQSKYTTQGDKVQSIASHFCKKIDPYHDGRCDHSAHPCVRIKRRAVRCDVRPLCVWHRKV